MSVCSEHVKVRDVRWDRSFVFAGFEGKLFEPTRSFISFTGSPSGTIVMQFRAVYWCTHTIYLSDDEDREIYEGNETVGESVKVSWG